jgi:predicted deacylase
MTEVIEVGPLAVRRGEKAYGTIPVAIGADGGNLGIGFHVIAGSRPGPKIVVMSTSHGNEYMQISALRRVLDETDPGTLRGDVVLVPVQNPVAFEMGSRGSWMDGLWGDSGNLNRLWPGWANGWLTERFTNAIATNLFAAASVVMDLHGPNRDLHLSYGYLGSGRKGDLSYDVARAFGQEMLVWNSPEELREKGQATSTATAYANLAGYVGYGGEIGEFWGLGSDRPNHAPEALHRDPAELGSTGITNVMKLLGMVEGDLGLPPHQVAVTPELNLRPRHGGLLISNVGRDDLGTVVPGGAVLGTVISPYSFEVLDEIVAPFDENILIACNHQKPFTKVLPGEFVFLVGDHSRTEVLD